MDQSKRRSSGISIVAKSISLAHAEDGWVIASCVQPSHRFLRMQVDGCVLPFPNPSNECNRDHAYRGSAFQTSPSGGSGSPKRGDNSAGWSRSRDVRRSDSAWRHGITRAKSRRPRKSRHPPSSILSSYHIGAGFNAVRGSWALRRLARAPQSAHGGILVADGQRGLGMSFFGRVARICMRIWTACLLIICQHCPKADAQVFLV